MCLYLEVEMLPLNTLESRGNYSATLDNMKLVHWPLMGGLLHLVQRRGDWADCGPAGPSSLYQMLEPTYQRPVYQSP